jgi:serine protease Do
MASRSSTLLARGSAFAGAAVLGFGLVAGMATLGTGTSLSALAQSVAVAPITAPASGPASFADVVEKAKPAVVSVRVKAKVAAVDTRGEDSGVEGLPPGHPLERFFRRDGGEGQRGMQGNRQRGDRPLAQSQGSGFFISGDGYVVTNNHVVEGAVEVTLVTDDGKTLTAKVIGTDPKTDLALLKADGVSDVRFVKFAPGVPRIGDWVMAIGNPFGLGGTVTAGIVSARGRDIGSGPYDDFLQIDAAVNRGNSGGPTFDLSGNVVGVNTAIYSPSGGNVGIAFAVPADTASKVIAELRDKGSVARGFIGVQIQPVTAEVADAIGLKEPRGALVAEAQGNGPAAKAGIRRGDTILAVDGEKISDARDLTRRIAKFAPGQKASITLWRDGKERNVTLEVGRQQAA